MSPAKLSLPKFGAKAKERLTLEYRVVLLGASSVGKTSIIRRLKDPSVFVESHEKTLEDLFEITQHFETNEVDITFKLHMLDTAGSYDFPAMRDLAIRQGNAFLLVYAVDDPSSFERACALKDLIFQIRGPILIPIVFVCNKIDLADQPNALSTRVTDSIISIDWEFGHVECSAKTNVNIRRIYAQLFKQGRRIKDCILEMETRLMLSPAAPTAAAAGGATTANSASQSPSSNSIGTNSDNSPIESPLSSSGMSFDYASSATGAAAALLADSRKSSMSDSELEVYLRNELCDSNCTIS